MPVLLLFYVLYIKFYFISFVSFVSVQQLNWMKYWEGKRSSTALDVIGHILFLLPFYGARKRMPEKRMDTMSRVCWLLFFLIFFPSIMQGQTCVITVLFRTMTNTTIITSIRERLSFCVCSFFIYVFLTMITCWYHIELMGFRITLDGFK